MTKNGTLTLFGFLLTSALIFGQFNEKTEEDLKNNWIVNFVNPAIEFEWASSNSTILSTALGIGYNGAYKELTMSSRGFNYIIQPFLDVQYKLMYNRPKRAQKNRIITKNSGNFVSLRAIARGWSLADNLIKTDDFDFAVGPTWGIQRSYGNFRFLVDIGPQYYFDSLGNDGFFPFMVQINLGFNLSK